MSLYLKSKKKKNSEISTRSLHVGIRSFVLDYIFSCSIWHPWAITVSTSTITYAICYQLPFFFPLLISSPDLSWVHSCHSYAYWSSSIGWTNNRLECTPKGTSALPPNPESPNPPGRPLRSWHFAAFYDPGSPVSSTPLSSSSSADSLTSCMCLSFTHFYSAVLAAEG